MTGSRGAGVAVTIGVLAGTLALTAAPVAAHGDLMLVSMRSDGRLGNLPSGTFGLSVSGDGGTVAFASLANNLFAADADRELDVYVKRLATGELLLASTSSDGVKAGAFSLRPSLDGSGSQVAFLSAADDLHEDDRDGLTDVFVKDLTTGAIVLASTTAAGAKGNAGSGPPVLSGDGQHVAFTSRASNLSPQDSDSLLDVYVKDLRSGALRLVTVGPDGRRAAPGPYGIGRLSLSADGHRVAFDTDAGLDPADTDGATDVYVKDLDTGALQLASTGWDGRNSAPGSYRPSLSGDGFTVAFDTFSADLLPGDASEDDDVYVKDLRTGALVLASTNASGDKANARSTEASLSADGRRVAFSSSATNLHPDDQTGTLDTYVKDIEVGTVQLASDPRQGGTANALSIAPTLAADGSLVAFATPASNLDPFDTNGTADVYARWLDPAPAAAEEPTHDEPSGLAPVQDVRTDPAADSAVIDSEEHS